MKKVAILLAADQNYSFAVANVIIGLKRWNEDLVSNIIVMHDINKATRDKISLIWKDKIIWKQYLQDDFIKDIDMSQEILEKFCNYNKYTIFSLCKFYIFSLLENYDKVIWLDSDMLITGSLKELIENNSELQGCKTSSSLAVEYLKLDNTVNNSKIEKVFRLGGGLIVADKKILTYNNCLTEECFKIVQKLYSFKFKNQEHGEKILEGADEFPFGVLIYKYNLSCRDLSGKENILLGASKESSNSTHIIIHGKWKNPLLISHQEWYINHKIWQEKYGGDEKIDMLYCNIPIASSARLHRFLYNLESLSFIYPLLSSFMAKELEKYNLYFHSLHSLPFFDIHSPYLKDKIFFRIVLPGYYKERIHIQLICKDVIFQNQNNTFLYKITEKLQGYNIISNNCITKAIYFNPYNNPELHKINVINELKIFFKTSFDILLPLLDSNTQIDILIQQKYTLEQNIISTNNYIVTRIQNHLSYKLGQAMIINSKSILGYIRMPFVLSYIKDK
ncbi:glycosyltransferase, partial [Campylobacter coli]